MYSSSRTLYIWHSNLISTPPATCRPCPSPPSTPGPAPAALTAPDVPCGPPWLLAPWLVTLWGRAPPPLVVSMPSSRSSSPSSGGYKDR
jgi:hypothetical protein